MQIQNLACYVVLFVTRILLVSSKQKDPVSLQKTYSGLLANITKINSVLKDLLRNYDEIKKIQGQKLSTESFEDQPNMHAEKDYESGAESRHKKSDSVPTQMPFESIEETGNLESIKEDAFKILNGNPEKRTAHDVVQIMDDMEDMYLEDYDSSIEDKPKPKRDNVKRNTYQEKDIDDKPKPKQGNGKSYTHQKKTKESSEEEEETAESASNEALGKRVTAGIMLRRVDAKDNQEKKTAEEDTVWYNILKKKLQQLANIEQIVKDQDPGTETPLEAKSGNHGDRRQQGILEEKDRVIHKTLRTEEYGEIACLKIDVKRCYMALRAALAKYCSGKYNCNDGFIDKFKRSSRVQCIQSFQADLVGNYLEGMEAQETHSEGMEASETNYSEETQYDTITHGYKEGRSRKKEGWVTKKPNYMRRVNKLSSENHNKNHEKVNYQHVKNVVQKMFNYKELDNVLNIIQMDAKRYITKRVLNDIETQPIKVENLYKLLTADTNIGPRLVKKVTKSKKIPLQTERTKLLETLLRTVPDNKIILRESNLQKLERECANIKIAKCHDACQNSMLENGITDKARKETIYGHCKTQCHHIFAFTCGGKTDVIKQDESDESGDSDESESDGSESDGSESEGSDSDSDSSRGEDRSEVQVALNP